MEIKYDNKVRLAELIKKTCDIDVNPDAMFDVQCKRLHEYKRQFMNILCIIHHYLRLKKLAEKDDPALKKEVPRVCIFSGKAAPGYYVAKLMIKLINNVGNTINNDPDTCDYLKCVFVPNYNVSLAGTITRMINH
jgi:starch phosphorylase